jgi:hypothetical protein
MASPKMALGWVFMGDERDRGHSHSWRSTMHQAGRGHAGPCRGHDDDLLVGDQSDGVSWRV